MLNNEQLNLQQDLITSGTSTKRITSSKDTKMTVQFVVGLVIKLK